MREVRRMSFDQSFLFPVHAVQICAMRVSLASDCSVRELCRLRGGVDGGRARQPAVRPVTLRWAGILRA